MLQSSQLSATLMTEPVLTLQKSPNLKKKKINLKTRENQPTAYEYAFHGTTDNRCQ